jgi:hypothetical protein
MRRIGIMFALWLLPVVIRAQWFDLRTPGIPRTAAGRPDLTAAPPKMPDGKPDLSGKSARFLRCVVCSRCKTRLSRVS